MAASPRTGKLNTPPDNAMNNPPLELEVTARTPMEMQLAQTQLIAWCENRVAAQVKEVEELNQEFETAKKCKYRSTQYPARISREEKRLEYYKKIKAALEAGYTIVPNFPISLFAIRTDKTKPAKIVRVTRTSWNPRHSFSQEAKSLPAGEGEYKNPEPVVETDKNTFVESGKELTAWTEEVKGWQDEIEFPFNMAKVQVMEATGKAMEKLIFDEIGICPQLAKKKEDPMIIGRILGPKAEGKLVSFIIAWHLNVRDL